MESNKKINLDPENSDNIGKFIENEILKDEEIFSFQNEFMQMFQFSKNYLNFLLEKVSKENKNFFIQVKFLKEKISFFTERRNLFINKKKDLLKEINRLR